jgi:hypothetical protein
MALASASLQAVVDAVTAGSTATEKTTALLAGLGPAIIKDITGFTSALTPNQQSKLTDAQADLAANVAAFVTALTVTP